MKKCIAKSNLKSVYVDEGKACKVFSPDYNKSDVLYEALNTSRVEDAGVNIPKLLSVTNENDSWVIISEYVEGKTLTTLMKEYPERLDDYIQAMVDYQISFQQKTNPLLLKLKDKLSRQINQLSGINQGIKYELLTRLESMPKHTKLCHGDYNTDNIIVSTDDSGTITAITAVDWVHATQGNASADVANTYLLLKLKDPLLAETYIDSFCKKTNTLKSYIINWLPIVAAARLTKEKPEEKNLLESWIDVVDYQ